MAGIRHDREFWERAYAEVSNGAKVGDVARRLGVRPRTLTWWCWRLRRTGGKPRRATQARFLPVVTAPRDVSTLTALSPEGVELEVASVRMH